MKRRLRKFLVEHWEADQRAIVSKSDAQIPDWK